MGIWYKGGSQGLLRTKGCRLPLNCHPLGSQPPLLSLLPPPHLHMLTWLQPACLPVCRPDPLLFTISGGWSPASSSPITADAELQQPIDLWVPISFLSPAACAEVGALEAALLWELLGFSN